MLLVAGVTASVLIQTMNSLQEQALKTGTETIRDISTGIKVTHVSGYYNGTALSQIAIFVTPIVASQDIDMSYSYVTMSDSTQEKILNYNSSVFSSTISDGLFGTLTSGDLNEDEFGIIVVRDIDSSITDTSPIINNGDLIVLLVNSSTTFSGIGTRTEVTGSIILEYGIRGVINFMTPSAFSDTIIDL